jgi:predicted nucleotidyltransferase
LTIRQDILSTLVYFDIFNYPITQSEIIHFCRKTYSHREFSDSLSSMVGEGVIFRFDEFYTLQNDYSVIPRRRTGNLKAKQMLKSADKVAVILSWFPFVRGIAISGSLSKNYADDQSDIDLFIITAKNRLWLARTLMHCLKKISFLVKREHLFCMNYYIDESQLEIKEKNIYTATEIATLLPLRGITAFREFYKKNTWSREYLPNHQMRVSYVKEMQRSIVKRFLEILLDNGFGNLLDNFFMKLTDRRWHKKRLRNKLNSRGQVMSMDAAKHCARPDPGVFQDWVVDIYEKKAAFLINKSEKRLKPVF